MTAHQDSWAAMAKMFDEAQLAEDEAAASAPPPPPSYGKDAPVKVKGMTPGMIGPPATHKPKAAAPPTKPADPNASWDADEVGEAGDADEDEDAGRAQPEYDVVFKQNVSPEDMFLGIDPLRNPGVAMSDELTLRVKLPGTKLADIELDVRSTFVRVGAPKFRLKAYLPEQVDEQKGNAKWDAEKAELKVTLPIIHDWDAKAAVSSANDLD